MPRYLVVANQTLGGAELDEVIRDRIAHGDTHFHILVPAIEPEHEAIEWNRGFALAEGMWEAPIIGEEARQAWEEAARHREELMGEAQARAQNRLHQMIHKIERAGGEADGEVGGSDPAAAVRDVLERHTFDEVIVSTLPIGLSRWLKMDLPSRVARMTSAPVTTVEADV